MTVIWWILGVLAVLQLLIGFLRVGVKLTFQGEDLTVAAAVGPLRFQILPKREKTAEEASHQTTAQETPPKKKQKKKGAKPSFDEIRDLICTLWPPLKKALARTRRSIRVNPLQLSVTVGGEEDPAASAQLYGELHGAVWTVMPLLEQLLVVRDPYVHIGIDFDAGKTTAEGTLGVSIRIGTVLRIAWTLGVPAVQWLLAFRKRHTAAAPKRSASAEATAN